jgi:hypothetical protein
MSALLAILLTLLPCAGLWRTAPEPSGAAASGTSYRRHALHELIINADLVVVGTIEALGAETYDFRVEATWHGSSPERIAVETFKDLRWVRRSRPYAVGQRMLLFLRPSEGDRYRALGVGNEGDMALVDAETVIVEYPLMGFANQRASVAGAQIWGAAVPLTELREALIAFKQAFAWEFAKGKRGNPTVPAVLRPRGTESDAAGFAAQSRFARHLHYEVVTRGTYESGAPEEPNRQVRGSLPHIELPGGESDFGRQLAWLDDLDGDGCEDWAGFLGSGLRHRVILGLSNGSAKEPQVVALAWNLPESDLVAIEPFGVGGALRRVDDLDGNGYPELLIGQPESNAVPGVCGNLWLVFLGERGAVLRSVALGSQTALADLLRQDAQQDHSDSPIEIGQAATPLGGASPEGLQKVALLTNPDLNREARVQCYVLTIDRQGTVVSVLRGFPPDSELLQWTRFSGNLSSVGDIDGDGCTDLALSAPYHPDGQVGSEFGPGALIIALLDPVGKVRSTSLISVWSGGLEARVRSGDRLVDVVVPVGDVDEDGTPDLIIGGRALGPSVSKGALWLLHLTPAGTVHSTTEIRDARHGFTDDGKMPYSLAVAPEWSSSGKLNLLLHGMYPKPRGKRQVYWPLALDRSGRLVSR